MSSITKKVSALPIAYSAESTDRLILLTSSGLKRLHDHSVLVRRPRVTDLNDATLTGYYCINANEGPTANVPEGHSYGTLIVINDGTSYGEEFTQIFTSISTPCCMYIRKKGSRSGFSPWYKIATTVVAGGGKTLFINKLRFRLICGSERRAA